MLGLRLILSPGSWSPDLVPQDSDLCMPKLALQKYRFAYSIACVFIILGGLCLPAKGQEQDRIERKVQNPNEAADAERKAMQRTVPTRQVNVTARMPSKPDEELLISADREEGQGNVVIYTGNVHLVYSDITLIGDRAAFNSATNDVTVEGNVFFEQMGQAVSAERLEMNLETYPSYSTLCLNYMCSGRVIE